MSKILNDLARVKLRTAMKQFTRAKALRAMTAENCTEERFSKHKNKHVRSRAEYLAKKSGKEIEKVLEEVAE